MSLERERFKTEIVDWVHNLAPWSLWFTGTFEGEFSENSARKAFERFMLREIPDVSYFYVTEKNPSKAGHHVHAMFADCVGLHWEPVWQAWFDRYGRNRLEPITSRQNVEAYCSKHLASYLTKGVGWYNFQLNSPELWHQAKAS